MFCLFFDCFTKDEKIKKLGKERGELEEGKERGWGKREENKRRKLVGIIMGEKIKKINFNV